MAMIYWHTASSCVLSLSMPLLLLYLYLFLLLLMMMLLLNPVQSHLSNWFGGFASFQVTLQQFYRCDSIHRNFCGKQQKRSKSFVDFFLFYI